jgi:hypothetical protein
MSKGISMATIREISHLLLSDTFTDSVVACEHREQVISIAINIDEVKGCHS